MKKIILENVRLMILAIIFSLGLGIAFAWTDPASAPPTGNALTPINRGPSAQVKTGGLWASSFGVDNGLVVMGNLGIGTLTPTYKLDVVGGISADSLLLNGSNGIKFPDGTVQTTASVPAPASKGFYAAVWQGKDYSANKSYSLNLSTGVANEGTILFLNGPFPAGTKAVGILSMNGWGDWSGGNGVNVEAKTVPGNNAIYVADAASTINFSISNSHSSMNPTAIFIGQ